MSRVTTVFIIFQNTQRISNHPVEQRSNPKSFYVFIFFVYVIFRMHSVYLRLMQSGKSSQPSSRNHSGMETPRTRHKHAEHNKKSAVANSLSRGNSKYVGNSKKKNNNVLQGVSLNCSQKRIKNAAKCACKNRKKIINYEKSSV